MAIVIGTKFNCDVVPPREGSKPDPNRPPLYRLSVEGMSFLVSDPVLVKKCEDVNGTIRVETRTAWKEGKRPTIWVSSVREVELTYA